MAKYYISCGDIRRVLNADSEDDALRIVFSDSCNILEHSLATTILVSQRGFKEAADKETLIYDTLKTIESIKPE